MARKKLRKGNELARNLNDKIPIDTLNSLHSEGFHVNPRTKLHLLIAVAITTYLYNFAGQSQQNFLNHC